MTGTKRWAAAGMLLAALAAFAPGWALADPGDTQPKVEFVTAAPGASDSEARAATPAANTHVTGVWSVVASVTTEGAGSIPVPLRSVTVSVVPVPGERGQAVHDGVIAQKEYDCPGPATDTTAGTTHADIDVPWDSTRLINGVYDIEVTARTCRASDPQGQADRQPIFVDNPPPPATAVKGSSSNAGVVHVVWAAPAVPDATGFQVLRAPSGDDRYTLIGTSPATAYDDSPGAGLWRYRIVSQRRPSKGDTPIGAAPSAPSEPITVTIAAANAGAAPSNAPGGAPPGPAVGTGGKIAPLELPPIGEPPPVVAPLELPDDPNVGPTSTTDAGTYDEHLPVSNADVPTLVTTDSVSVEPGTGDPSAQGPLLQHTVTRKLSKVEALGRRLGALAAGFLLLVLGYHVLSFVQRAALVAPAKIPRPRSRRRSARRP